MYANIIATNENVIPKHMLGTPSRQKGSSVSEEAPERRE